MTDELPPLAEDPADESHPPRSRAELWERIRTSSRHDFIVDEMVRLGFWNRDAPTRPPEPLTREIRELEKEIRELTADHDFLADRDRRLRHIRKTRLAEARERRRESKERRERDRLARAEAWAERQRTEILYLGEGVSAGLGPKGRELDGERLSHHSLPRIRDAAELALRMEITLPELRFLAFHRKVAETTHYRRFTIPKRTGGRRLISAPMPRLKASQRWITEQILNKVPIHAAAHGFARNRNIVTNARQHVGRRVVINLDLKDFFPTLTYRRVKGLFRSLGYGEEPATIFALLCTEPEVDAVELDGTVRYLHRGDRHLPQGSPASPAISNLICRRMDRRLEGLATSLSFVYTRYADDLSFSADEADAKTVGRLLRAVRGIVEHEDFVVHPEKTRIMHRGTRQEVTGLTVNERPNIDRRTKRRLRALIYQLEKDGPVGKSWAGLTADGPESAGRLLASLLGYACYAQMVDRPFGEDLARRLKAVIAAHQIRLPQPPTYPDRVPSWKQLKEPGETEGGPTASSASPGAGSKPWWKRLKFW